MKLMRLRKTADEDPESDPALDLDPVLVPDLKPDQLVHGFNLSKYGSDRRSELCTMRHSGESLLRAMWHSLKLTLRCAA
jgi:hypothetical protein